MVAHRCELHSIDSWIVFDQINLNGKVKRFRLILINRHNLDFTSVQTVKPIFLQATIWVDR